MVFHRLLTPSIVFFYLSLFNEKYLVFFLIFSNSVLINFGKGYATHIFPIAYSKFYNIGIAPYSHGDFTICIDSETLTSFHSGGEYISTPWTVIDRYCYYIAIGV